MQYINLAVLLMMIIITSISFVLIKNTNFSKSKFAIQKMDKKFKNKSNSLEYEKIEKYLKTMGINEAFNRTINPTEFILVKIVLAFLLFVGLLKKSIFLTPCGFLGFFLPNIVLRISNSVDNKEILPDLKKVYDTLRIQTKAGVFLTTSLTECYLAVKNPRLKKALLELNNNIVLKNDIEEAIDEFNSKFRNSYIDTFCIVIKQSMSSGKTVQILDDLSAQIADIHEAMNIKFSEKIKRKLEVKQLLIFIGVIAIVVFGIISQLNQSLISF